MNYIFIMICKTCGIIFIDKKHKDRVYCSRKCSSLDQKIIRNYICKKCSKPFTHYKKNKTYCSNICANQDKIRTSVHNKKIGAAQKGSKHYRWKGGSFINDCGYRMIYDPSVPKRYVPEHRRVMEQFLGRKLLRKEVVHHINEDRLDNRIENLELLPGKKEHMDKHKIWLQQTEEGIRKMGLAHVKLHKSPTPVIWP